MSEIEICTENESNTNIDTEPTNIFDAAFKVGLEKGRKIGIRQAKLQCTRNLLLHHFPINDICEIMEVSAKFVLSVQRGLHKELLMKI